MTGVVTVSGCGAVPVVGAWLGSAVLVAAGAEGAAGCTLLVLLGCVDCVAVSAVLVAAGSVVALGAAALSVNAVSLGSLVVLAIALADKECAAGALQLIVVPGPVCSVATDWLACSALKLDSHWSMSNSVLC